MKGRPVTVDAYVGLTPYDDLERQYTPLIAKLARHANIPGLLFEDVQQELRVVLWRAQQRYVPGTISRTNGRTSGFTNYLITGCHNRLGYLKARSEKFYNPVSALECMACGERTEPRPRARCVCGGRRWRNVRNDPHFFLGSLDVELTVEPSYGETFGGLDEYELLASLPAEAAVVARRALAGFRLSLTERRVVRRAICV